MTNLSDTDVREVAKEVAARHAKQSISYDPRLTSITNWLLGVLTLVAAAGLVGSVAWASAMKTSIDEMKIQIAVLATDVIALRHDIDLRNK